MRVDSYGMAHANRCRNMGGHQNLCSCLDEARRALGVSAQWPKGEELRAVTNFWAEKEPGDLGWVDLLTGGLPTLTSARETQTAPKSTKPKISAPPREELSPKAREIVKTFVAEKLARDRLSDFERETAAKLKVGAIEFETMKAKEKKAAGFDGCVSLTDEPTDSEIAVAKAIGLDPKKYAEHKRAMTAQLRGK